MKTMYEAKLVTNDGWREFAAWFPEGGLRGELVSPVGVCAVADGVPAAVCWLFSCPTAAGGCLMWLHLMATNPALPAAVRAGALRFGLRCVRGYAREVGAATILSSVEDARLCRVAGRMGFHSRQGFTISMQP
ncbi:hypothetical protein [Akkermansia glycaniphila]|uniref:Acyl-coa n-acyltransferase n=1 Tax=Akkermansia glycaniphila TaxID=1679444 RepID=A0A1H6MJ00_9BACT|nr:hypothetical protein [Akkermansia glycaniphila]SEH99351.1 Hypothetical protein PYTT_2383 [Akkermansia glycaniphila]